MKRTYNQEDVSGKILALDMLGLLSGNGSNGPSQSLKYNYVRKTNSSDQTNLNSNTSNSVNYDEVSFNNNTSLFIDVANGIQISNGCLIRVTAQVNYTANNNRTNVPIQIAVNNVPRLIRGASGYIRNSSGHNESSVIITDLFYVNAGDVITILGEREAGAGTVTLSAYHSNLLIENFSTVTGQPVFPNPIITAIEPKTVNSNTTTDVEIKGAYFTIGTTVNITNQTINSIIIVDDNHIIVNITSTGTDGFYDVTVDNGYGSITATNGLEVRTSTWIDLRLGGEVLTDGNASGNDIRYRSGMSMTRDANGMYFTGSNPWSSWVKFEKYSWTRGTNKTLSWILTAPDNSIMIGIGSDATDENSTSQYAQMEVEFYFNTSTNIWGLYGNDGTVGNYGNQSHSVSVNSTDVLKLIIDGDGDNGDVVYVYRLPSANQSDWDDTSTLLDSWNIGGSINPNETNIMPVMIPRNGGNQRFIALKVE